MTSIDLDGECQACFGSGREHQAKKGGGQCPGCGGRGRVLSEAGTKLLMFVSRWLEGYKQEEGLSMFVGHGGAGGAAGHGGGGGAAGGIGGTGLHKTTRVPLRVKDGKIDP